MKSQTDKDQNANDCEENKGNKEPKVDLKTTRTWIDEEGKTRTVNLLENDPLDLFM